MASSSPEKSHIVIAASHLWWLIALLVMILIALTIWRYLRTH